MAKKKNKKKEAKKDYYEFPKSLRVLGIDYDVDYDDLLEQGVAGKLNNITCEIVVGIHNAPEHMQSVIIHEVIECLNYRLELDLPHSHISQIEAGVISFIKDNPKFIKSLVS